MSSPEVRSPLNEEYLQDISRAVWGGGQYGAVATEIFRVIREKAQICSVQRTRTGAYRLVAPHYDITGQNSIVGQSRQGLETAARNAHTILETQADVPFDYTFKPCQGNGGTVLTMQQGTVTAPRLHRYLEQRGIGEHRLRGALGKGFDVLLYAAGVSFVPQADRECREDFIPLDGSVIRQAIAETSANPATRMALLRKKVLTAVHRQVLTHEPALEGEVILEAHRGFRAGRTRVPLSKDLHIARTSLMAVGDMYARGTSVVSALYRLAEEQPNP